MQIFISHSSKQKPLVREIRKGLPEHINAWIDENKLIFGDSIPAKLEETIKSDTDYVLLFIDGEAAKSKWVLQEVSWTLDLEKQNNRTILLPIVLELDALDDISSIELRNRKYLRLQDFRETSVTALSALITSELFALICRDMQSLRKPKVKSAIATISDAEVLIRATANVVQKAIFPHRQSNPISKERLVEVIGAHDGQLLSAVELDSMLTNIVQHNLIPGLVYDGYELYLREEHSSWKASHASESKQKIARKVAGLIRTGSSVFLDAGSTVEEIVSIICKKIENRAINNIRIATTSVNIADMISDCCVRMGFDDEFCAVNLYVPSGKIRPNTQAIVAIGSDERRPVLLLADQIGQFDIGIVGVNGVDSDGHFTTHDNLELANKTDILQVSMKKLIIGDSTKVGIKLDTAFATFADDVVFVTNEDPDNAILKDMVCRYPGKILLAS